MKRPIYLIITVFATAHLHCQLLPIVDNDKVGYIDITGKMVIPAVFNSGAGFSEGLAPVRKGGLYGYINSKGEFEIQPQFDYAFPFVNGFAVVFNEGRPSYISKNGKQPFPTPFKIINDFDDGRAEIITYSGKHGFINSSGKLIIDTVFRSIRPFSGGLAVVESWNKNKNRTRKGSDFDFGVIDTNGRFVVPFGKFGEIQDFKNGYARFEIAERLSDNSGESAQGGFIDRNGKIVFARYNKNGTRINGDINDGRAKINLYKYWVPEEKGVLYSTEKSYVGYIDPWGKIVLNDTTLINSTDFGNGRAFVNRKWGNSYMIDTNGKRVSNKSFNRVSGEGFHNGIAIVQEDYQWGIINPDGDYLVSPQFEEINSMLPDGRHFVFSDQVMDSSKNSVTRYGLGSLITPVIIPPVFEKLDWGGFKNGLIGGVINGRLSYFDSTGKLVWQQPQESKVALCNLDIDYMNRGYFFATQTEKFGNFQGWALSNNIPEKVRAYGTNKNLLITIDTSINSVYGGRYNGYQLSVVNYTKQTVSFNAQDDRLYMVLQAQDSKGVWREIEYLPSSWCGNSYHTLDLKSGEQWTFTIPVYEGAIPTKIRAELRVIDPTDKSAKGKKREIVLYSNSINGFVNPGQFWRKPEYFPSGLMDPYND